MHCFILPNINYILCCYIVISLKGIIVLTPLTIKLFYFDSSKTKPSISINNTYITFFLFPSFIILEPVNTKFNICRRQAVWYVQNSGVVRNCFFFLRIRIYYCSLKQYLPYRKQIRYLTHTFCFTNKKWYYWKKRKHIFTSIEKK